MLDQLIGLLLLGLGIQSPQSQGYVKGETVNVLPASTESENEVEGSEEEDESDDEKETDEDDAKLKAATEEVRREKQEKIHEMKEEAAKKRAEYKASLRLKKEAFKISAEASRAAYKESVSAAREAFAAEVKARREEIRANSEARRAAFRVKLEEIRDERKKELVEDIQERILELNTKRTDAMTAHLNKMDEILSHILEKAEEQKIAGKDITRVVAAVTTAETALENAKTAVTTQAGKPYIITITSEENLRSNVGTVRSTMEIDLKGVHSLVVAARRAVSDAIAALAVLRGEPVPEAVVK